MEVADGREYRTLVSSLGAGRGEYRQGDIGADGLLAVGMDDGARLWDLATGREVAFLPAGWTDSVSFVTRPDGRELLTCGPSGLRRWPIREDPEAPGRLRIGPPRTVRPPFIPIAGRRPPGRSGRRRGQRALGDGAGRGPGDGGRAVHPGAPPVTEPRRPQPGRPVGGHQRLAYPQRQGLGRPDRRDGQGAAAGHA